MKSTHQEEYYRIFHECFPELAIAKEKFLAQADFVGEKETTRILERYADPSGRTFSDKDGEGRVLAGFAVVEEDHLRLLLVKPQFQRKYGVGAQLLGRAEKAAATMGYSKLILGSKGSHLFLGAVGDSKGFFEKRGYKMGETYEEQDLDLKDFAGDEVEPVVTESGDRITFGWYDGPREALLEAVTSVIPEWGEYYKEDTNVYCGCVNGEIASFCLLETCDWYLKDDGNRRIWAPGCVGTVPKYRRRGIGLAMVWRVTKMLQEQDERDISYIHYTGVGHWYARLGYKTFLNWTPGEKKLTTRFGENEVEDCGCIYG